MYLYDRLSPRVSSTLDLLRWVSAELVVLTHARSLVLAPWSEVPQAERGPLTAGLYALSAMGHQAVIVFFVLSGFLVGGSAINDFKLGRFSLGRYLVSRVSRLYVVLIPALLLGWVLDAIGLRWFDAGGFYTGQWPHTLSAMDYDASQRLGAGTLLGNLANLQMIAFPTLGSNGPLWSLAYEWWYYVLFPLAVLPFLPRQSPWRRLAWLAAAIALGALIYPRILLYGLLWLLGAAARLAPRSPVPWPSAMAVVLAIAAVALSRISHLGSGELTDTLADFALGVVFWLFLVSVMHGRTTATLPATSLHTALAGYSYSLYLLHFPLLALSCAACQSWWGTGLSMQPTGMAPWLLLVAALLLVNAYAWGISQLTERHTTMVRGWLMRLLMPGAKP